MLDIIIPVKNKNSVNKVISELNLHFKLINQIIIVDFDRSNPSFLSGSFNCLVKEVYVDSQTYFNKSLAINIGMYYSLSETVIICDADVILNQDFILHALKMNERKFLLSPECVIENKDGSIREAPGICAFRRKDFFNVNGYCSDFIGWGSEDRDFLERMKRTGIVYETYSKAIHLSHNNFERIQNYPQVSINETRYKNRELLKKRLNDPKSEGTYESDIKKYLN